MRLNASVLLGFSLITSCSTGDFTGSADTAINAKTCIPGNGKTCEDSKKSLDEPTLVTQDDGSIKGTCQYLDLSQDSEGFMIPGGPPIKIKPSDLKNGVREGDTLFVDINAYQGPAGAGGAKTNRLYAAVLNEDGSIKDPSKLKQYAPHIIPAVLASHGVWHSANEWSLTAFPRKGGQVPVAIKHEYRVQVSPVDSADCKISAYNVTQPYYTRGPNYFNPQTDIDTGGCFALSTKIKMADGSEKLAVNIEKGDRLFNPATKKHVTVSEVVYGPEEKLGLIMVGIGDRAVKVTTQHPFETANGLKSAADLTIDDKILTARGQYQKLTTLKVLAPVKNQKVINFVVSSNSKNPIDHMILADGVITGDLYLQRQLSRKVEQKLKEMNSKVAAKH